MLHPTPAPKAAAKKKSLEPIVAEPANSEKNKTMKKTQTDSIPDIVEQPMVKEKASKKADSDDAKKAVKKIKDNQERSTLGDISALSDLKDKMDGK